MRGDVHATRDTATASSAARSGAALAAALIALHVVLSSSTLLLYLKTDDVPAPYLASGVAWAGMMLLRGGIRAWFAAGIFLSQFAGELAIYDSPVWVAVAFSASKTLCAVIGVWAVQRIIGNRLLRPALADILTFIAVGCIAVPLVMALPPHLAKVVAFDVGLRSYIAWVLLESTGIVVMAPALLFWLRRDALRIAASRIELLGLVIATTLVLVFAFIVPGPTSEHQHTAFYAATPVMIWAAARYGCRGAGLINLVLTLVMIGAALIGSGPFHDLRDLALSVLELQVFLIIVSIMTLLLGAYAEGREAGQLQRAADKRRLQQLSLRLLESEERYRDRLATRLHDGVGQSLALGRMRLEDLIADPATNTAAADRLVAVRDAVDTAVSQIRDMTRDVAAGLYRGDDIAAAVHHHMSTVFDGTGIETAVTSDALPELRHEVAIVLSRAIRECLVNAAKHAGATRVRVNLGVEDHPPRFVARVQDDGRGFDVASLDLDAASGDRFGMASVRNSMLALGGGFDVDAAPGQGAVITLSLPLPRAVRD